MLLALDVGNTNVVIGVYRGRGKDAELAGDWRIGTDRDKTADEYGMALQALLAHGGLKLGDIRHVAISSVVPPMSRMLSELARRYFKTEAFFVSAQGDIGIAIHYKGPVEVGADRICDAVGAFAKYGGPAIVVDYGTATTFNAIAANGDYLGGAIAPGIGISMDALFQRASRLHRVEFAAPPRAIGETMAEAMQSGLVFGYAGQTDAIVARIRKELGGGAKVIATGGLAPLIQTPAPPSRS
ncbi:MAG: type III pantothenate kinase [Alphaproteobacteria bacterium]